MWKTLHYILNITPPHYPMKNQETNKKAFKPKFLRILTPPSGGVIQIRADQGRGFGLGGGRGRSFGQKRFKMAVVVFLSILWPLSLHLIMLSYTFSPWLLSADGSNYCNNAWCKTPKLCSSWAMRQDCAMNEPQETLNNCLGVLQFKLELINFILTSG